jgi:hypothetical protein
VIAPVADARDSLEAHRASTTCHPIGKRVHAKSDSTYRTQNTIAANKTRCAQFTRGLCRVRLRSTCTTHANSIVPGPPIFAIRTARHIVCR